MLLSTAPFCGQPPSIFEFGVLLTTPPVPQVSTLPLGENCSDHTRAGTGNVRISFLPSTSHILQTLSTDAEATFRPSGEIATAQTSWLWLKRAISTAFS